MPPPLNEAIGLTKHYRDFTVVAGISFRVEQNECFGLLGPNGAGKSTTIKMLSAVTPPTSGSLTVFGFDAWKDARAVKARIGVVPQEDNFDPDLPVRQNLEVYARYYGLSKREAGPRIDEALALALMRRRLIE